MNKRVAVWGAVGLAVAGILWFSANQAKPAVPSPDAAAMSAEKKAIEIMARKRLASAMVLFRSAEKSEFQGDLARALILYRQARSGFLAVSGHFPGSKAALALQASGSTEANLCAAASRKVDELAEVGAANRLWQFLWQASLRGDVPSSFVIDSLRNANAKTGSQVPVVAAPISLPAGWAEHFELESAVRWLSAGTDAAACGASLIGMVTTLQGSGRTAEAEKLLDAAWDRVDADARISAALILGRYRKALEISRDAADRARIAVAASRTGAFADLAPSFHRYCVAAQPGAATREVGILTRELLAAGQRPAALLLAGGIDAARNSEAVERLVADLLKSPDDEVLLGLVVVPGAAASRCWHDAMLVRLQETPALLEKLTERRGRTPPGALRDQLAILAMEQAAAHDGLDQAKRLLAEVSGKEEKRLALERLAEVLADHGSYLAVRQIIRDQDPATTDGMWIALACGYARTGTMADALKIVDQQVAGKENRQRAIVAIARRFKEAGRHPAAILTLSKLDDRGQQLGLIYEFAATLSQDRESPDYVALKEMIRKYPVEEQVRPLQRKWTELRQELLDNPVRIDDPQVLAWLRFCKNAYALTPAAWLPERAEPVPEPYPFAAAEQAFDRQKKPQEALEIRRLVWKHGDAAVRQALLGRMLGCDSFQEIAAQIAALPDHAEADRCFHRLSALLIKAQRYEEALALVAMVSARGDRVDATRRQAWLDEVKGIALAMSEQRIPLSSRMEETVAQIGNLLPPDSSPVAGKPSTPD